MRGAVDLESVFNFERLAASDLTAKVILAGEGFRFLDGVDDGL